MKQTNTTKPAEERQAIDAADNRAARWMMIGICTIAAAYTAAYYVASASSESECLKMGYPQGKADMALNKYCTAGIAAIPIDQARRAAK